LKPHPPRGKAGPFPYSDAGGHAPTAGSDESRCNLTHVLRALSRVGIVIGVAFTIWLLWVVVVGPLILLLLAPR
jgi:hypothetical protein